MFCGVINKLFNDYGQMILWFHEEIPLRRRGGYDAINYMQEMLVKSSAHMYL